MYRGLVLAVSLILTSEARSASDVYAIDFPPQAVRPVVASKCEGLDLPCRSDWASLFTFKFRPFKWAQSVFRFPKAPAQMHNVFAYVEIPFIEHGEDDYNRLQQMFDQTGPSAERLWAYSWNLGFDGANFGTQYRVVHAVIQPTKALDVVALCAFPVLKGKTAAPDRCDLMAFRIENRRFLLSSVGFEIGGTDAISPPRYNLKLGSGSSLNDYDSKAEILKSRHELETSFNKVVSSALKKSALFKNAIATDQSDDFATSKTNKSEKGYLVLKRGDSDKKPGTSYFQTIQLNFELETGEDWSAEMADGTDREGIMLRGGKQDWTVTLKWETRTVVGVPTVNPRATSVFTFQEPRATGIDMIGEVWSALTDSMRDVCAPLAVSDTSAPESSSMGSASLSCLGK